MTRRKSKKEEIVQSSMRLPKRLWEALDLVSRLDGSSMAQTVEQAVIFHCQNAARTFGKLYPEFEKEISAKLNPFTAIGRMQQELKKKGGKP